MVRGVTGGGDDDQSQGLLPPLTPNNVLDLFGSLAVPEEHACADATAMSNYDTNISITITVLPQQCLCGYFVSNLCGQNVALMSECTVCRRISLQLQRQCSCLQSVGERRERKESGVQIA